MTSKAAIQQAYAGGRRSERELRHEARSRQRLLLESLVQNLLGEIRPMFERCPRDTEGCARWDIASARETGILRELGPRIERTAVAMGQALIENTRAARRKAYLRAINAGAVTLVHAGVEPRVADDPVSVITGQPKLRPFIIGNYVIEVEEELREADTIAGNLCRGDGGRYEACGAGGIDFLELARSADVGDVGPPAPTPWRRGRPDAAPRGGEVHARPTGTPEFKRWFAGSKVANEDGSPAIVYHATHSDFDAFSTEPRHGESRMLDSIGAWFGSQGLVNTVAEFYGANPDKEERRAGAQRVLPVYLSIANPLVIQSRRGFEASLITRGSRGEHGHDEAVKASYAQLKRGDAVGLARKLKDELIHQGYDGILVKDDFGLGSSWIAFHPEQVKSALSSRAFDPDSPRFAEAFDPNQPRDDQGQWTAGAGSSGAASERVADTGVPFTPELRPQREAKGGRESTIALGKRLEKEIHPDTMVWVYHVTDKETAAKFAAEGINPADKPSNFNRRAYEEGRPEEVFFQPGAGLAPGLTVGLTPRDIDGYGRTLVAVRVRFGDISTSPEAEQLGNKTGAAALAINDAQVRKEIPASDVRVIQGTGDIRGWTIPYWREDVPELPPAGRGPGPKAEAHHVADAVAVLQTDLGMPRENAERVADQLTSLAEYMEPVEGARHRVTAFDRGAMLVVENEYIDRTPTGPAVLARGRWVVEREGDELVIEPVVLYLHPKLQGQGIGKKVMEDGERVARENGISKLRFLARSDEGHGFVGAYVWHKLGYVPSDKSRREVVTQYRNRVPGADTLDPDTATIADIAKAAAGKAFLLGKYGPVEYEVERDLRQHKKLQESWQPDRGQPLVVGEPAEPVAKRVAARVILLDSDGMVWVIRGEAGDLRESDGDCGTGAGGFQQGNTCAKGGGGAGSQPKVSKRWTERVDLTNAKGDKVRRAALIGAIGHTAFQQAEAKPARAVHGAHRPLLDRIADAAGHHAPTLEEAKQRLDAHVATAMSRAHVGVRVTTNTLNGIIDAGRLKTQHEVGRSVRGEYDPAARARVERSLYGKSQPIYGYVFEDLDHLRYRQESSRYQKRVSHYGPVTLVLKDEVKGRTTFATDDTLAEYDANFRKRVAAAYGESPGDRATVPTPMTATEGAHRAINLKTMPQLLTRPSVDDWNTSHGATEAQIHGAVTLDDVAKVQISWDTVSHVLAKQPPPGDDELSQRYHRSALESQAKEIATISRLARETTLPIEVVSSPGRAPMADRSHFERMRDSIEELFPADVVARLTLRAATPPGGQLLREADSDCGTGAGGFQAGNTCGKGEGSSAPVTLDPAELTGNPREDIGDAETAERMPALLKHYGAERPTWQGQPLRRLYVDKPDDLYVVEAEGKKYVVEVDPQATSYPASVTEASEWVDNVDPTDYIPETDQSAEFWQGPAPLYHATTPENARAILDSGLEARAETRGISNRSTGSAVFTVVDPEGLADGSYGDVILQIDTEAMKRDGLTPRVASEEPISESEGRNSLAHALGLRDYYSEPDSSDGFILDTQVVFGDIPAKYVSVYSGEPKRGTVEE